MRDSRDRNLEAHFSFGQNWSDCSELVSETPITFAENELSRLMNTDNLQDLKWCDLGCGSGIHSVAAARLGATVTAVDSDPISTATTEKLARKFGVESKIEVLNFSVFDHSLSQESFDVVYSWGVLHHIVDMWSAIDGATALCSKNWKSICCGSLPQDQTLSFVEYRKKVLQKCSSIRPTRSPWTLRFGVRPLATCTT
jgi:ribosomal protein L11 methylase PrmA